LNLTANCTAYVGNLFRKKSKPYATLEFGILDPDKDDIVKPLTDKTIRTTQAVIEQTIRLDFESFCNSAFLRQGNANEFSKKSPKDRKQVLATILGLNQYETIRKLAADKSKQAINEKNTLLMLQEKIAQDVEQEPVITQQLTDVNKQLHTLAKQYAQLCTQEKTLRTKQKEYAAQQPKQHALRTQLEQRAQEEHKQQQQLRSLFGLWRSVQHKKRKLPDKQKLEAEKKRVVNEINEHQQQLQQSLKIKEAYLQAKEQAQCIVQQHNEQHTRVVQRVQVELERLNTEQDNATKKVHELQTQQQKSNAEVEQLRKELNELQQKKSKRTTTKEYNALEQQFEKRKAHYQKYITQGNVLSTQLRNLEQKKQLAHDDNDPSCPLCEQNLSASRRRFLKAKFDQQEQFIMHQLARIKHLITRLKQMLIEQHKQLTALKKVHEDENMRALHIQERTKEQEKVQRAINELQKNLDTEHKEHTKRAQQIKTKQNELKQLQAHGTQVLEKNTEYQATKKQLHSLEQQAKAIRYDTQKHQHAQQQLQTLEQQWQEYEQMREQLVQQEQRKQTIGELCATLKNIKQQKLELEKELKNYNALPKQQAALDTQEQELKKAHANLNTQKETLLQQKGSLQAQQKKLEHQKKEHTKYTKQTNELEQTICDYQAIATATSKDGIQALLIEDAIPEIEQEANCLLAKLTNNQMQLFIDSLRDLKKGGTKETLDIKISDPSGIRPYELFSGGEAFRIDFALRLAISKLLARRAGTALQTLIIDEGFGSQDEEGLAHIMDAIYKIQDDFSKVIIVSHLNSLKEQFPVHFVVEKHPNGAFLSFS